MTCASVCAIVCSLLLAASTSATSSTHGSDQHILTGSGRLDRAFDEFVEQTLAQWHVPGLSIAVIEHGKTQSKGYGYAILPDVRATPDTQWFTGSTTKAFTAAALAQLIHDPDHYPDLKWSTPLTELIRDDFVLEDDYATTHTTLEDALSHRTGMPGHDLMYGFEGDDVESIVRRMRYLPMNAQPRTKWQYCNIMYVAVTRCIESLTGMKLEEILRSRFWEPLGMKDTTFNVSAAEETSRLARGYFWDERKKRYVAEPYIDLLPVSGAGATISTVEDYALWLNALLSASRGHENASSPVSPAILRDLVTPRSFVDLGSGDPRPSLSPSLVTPPVYSLGWIGVNALGRAIVTHTGGLTGFGTTVYLVPEKNVGIIIMANTVGTSHYAEAVIGSRLLANVLQGDGLAAVSTRELQASLEATLLAAMRKTELTPESQTSSRKRDGSSTIQMSPPGPYSPGEAHQPFPVGKNASASIVGIYSSPAYGTLNLTAVTASNKTDKAELAFETFLYPRTWPRKLVLRHASYTIFHVETYFKHGVDGDRVWEDVSDEEQIAFVELDLYGQIVVRIGFQLDGDALNNDREKGWEGDWRRSMIWFERVRNDDPGILFGSPRIIIV